MLHFPQLSIRLLEEAIQDELAPSNSRKNLIMNPNNNSIFYTQFDCNSPVTSQALKNLNMKEEDTKIISFAQYNNGIRDETVENVVNYLHYITKIHKSLKKLLKERIKIKAQYHKNSRSS